MRLFIAAIIAIIFVIPGYGQSLKKVRLNEEDRKSGVYLKFIYSEDYGFISLVFKKDSTYAYYQRGCATYSRSEGRWRKVNGVFVLESTFKEDNVPVELLDSVNGKYVDSCDIAIMYDAKQKVLTEAYVLINNDSTVCLPDLGGCNRPYGTINRVKVKFYNGISSMWVPIKPGTRKVHLRVLAEMPLWDYMVMDRWTFKIKRRLFKPTVIKRNINGDK
ncbi:MAG: hypothetical protein JO154_06590 [Chitinophaga sp.]|uniref:hypothetical protein n=1 Tax=Chitinophaga sp. TaxID=1869181 RepID=UPI0025BC8353|nr:hypothetical protein [Chitinophaga sp.]MBV8252260.1 hypothetical protein [Chitinophaga sp.]